MKKTFHLLAFFSLIFSLLFTSCGSSKKLMDSEAKVDKLQKDNANNANTISQLNDCNEKVKNLDEQKTSLQNEYTILQNEYSMVQNDLKALSSESKMTIADQAKRLKSLKDMIQSQKDVMNRLKNSIADALMNYKTDELYVYNKDGNVYVALEEKLLFKSGSDVVDPKGKEALKSLAMVLNSTKDITVMIEGHTDNVPIKTSLFKDNWDLSTARATSIVRILTVDYGFDSNRITASGRGQFHPVKTNETDEGRAGNRRIEVILSPDLNEIFKLLYQ
jgi:chemotaxis protein MotB